MADDEKARAKAAAAAERAAARAASAAAKAAGKAAAKAARAAAKAAAQAEVDRKVAAATVEWNRAISVANAIVVRKCQEAHDEWDVAAQRLGDEFMNHTLREANYDRSMKAIADIEQAKIDAAWDEWGAAKDAADEAFSAATGGWRAPYRHPEWEHGRPDTRWKPPPRSSPT